MCVHVMYRIVSLKMFGHQTSWCTPVNETLTLTILRLSHGTWAWNVSFWLSTCNHHSNEMHAYAHTYVRTWRPGKQNGPAGLTCSYCIHCYHCNIVLHIIDNILLRRCVEGGYVPLEWDVLRRVSISARDL